MSNTTNYWMPLHIGDFLRATTHLTPAQCGAYILLLAHYWTKRSLPVDDATLARITRQTVRGWLNMKPAVEALFGPGWSHPELDQELIRTETISRMRSISGTKGGQINALHHMQKKHIQNGQMDVPSKHIHLSDNALKRLKPH